MADSLIGSLRVALSLGTAEFEAGANKAAAISRAKAKEISGAFNSARSAVNGLFAAFTVGLLTEQIKKSLDYAGSIAEVSRTLGVTTKDLQTFRFAATQTGVAQDQLEVGLRRLTVSMGKAELGSKGQIKAFGALGITVEQLKGKTTGDVFRLMAESLSKVTDRSQRAAIEMTLMGRSGSTLDNLLAPGSKRLNDLADAAQRLGIVLSDSQIQGAEETAHKLAAVKEVLAAQIAGVVASNAQAILSLSSALATLTGQVIKFLGSNPQLALGIIGGLAGGRIGGAPGAIIGAAGGALLGSKVAQSAADSNTDLTFRTQQMRAAQQEYLTRLGEQHSGSLLTVRHGNASSGATVQQSRDEFFRQLNLLKGATAQARAGAQPRAPGVTVPQFLGGGGGGGRTRHPRESQGPQDQTEQEQFQFAQQQRQMDIQILDAKRSLSHSFVEQTSISLQMLDIQEQIKDADIDHKVAQAERDAAAGKITQSTLRQIVIQADIEKADQAHLTDLQKRAVIDAALERTDQAIFAGKDQQYRFGIEALQSADGLAMTQADHRRIQLEILDEEIAQQRLELEHTKQLAIRNGATKQEIDNIQAQIDHLPTQRAQGAAAINQGTQGPLEGYLNSLPTTSAKWQEALQGVAVNGFGALEQAILDTVSGTKKLGQAFKEMAMSIISDLLKISIERSIIAPLAQGLSGAMGGSSGGGPGGSLGGLGGLLGSLFGGGAGGALGGASDALGGASSIVEGASGLGDMFTVASSLPGFASGGSMLLKGLMGSDRNMLAMNGVPIARVGYGEQLHVTPKGAGGSPNAPPAFHFNNYAKMSDSDARRTGMQAAAAFNEEIARARRKGIS